MISGVYFLVRKYIFGDVQKEKSASCKTDQSGNCSKGCCQKSKIDKIIEIIENEKVGEEKIIEEVRELLKKEDTTFNQFNQIVTNEIKKMIKDCRCANEGSKKELKTQYSKLQDQLHEKKLKIKELERELKLSQQRNNENEMLIVQMKKNEEELKKIAEDLIEGKKVFEKKILKYEEDEENQNNQLFAVNEEKRILNNKIIEMQNEYERKIEILNTKIKRKENRELFNSYNSLSRHGLDDSLNLSSIEEEGEKIIDENSILQD